jgi:putative Holliday junction resolvase
MRILGIDYGSKRVGVALSDEAGKFAIPLIVVKNGRPDRQAGKSLLEEVAGLAKTNEVKEIVLGESRAYDMSENKIMPAIMAFKKELERAGFKVHFQLEFMTSVQAERFQGKNEMSDASAAALILQAYIDGNH